MHLFSFRKVFVTCSTQGSLSPFFGALTSLDSLTRTRRDHFRSESSNQIVEQFFVKSNHRKFSLIKTLNTIYKVMCKFTSHTPLREKKVWSHCNHQDVAMAETMLFVSLVPQAPPSFPSIAVEENLRTRLALCHYDVAITSQWCLTNVSILLSNPV